MPGYYSLPGMVAGADLTAKQYHAVRFNTTERQIIAITDANAQQPIGVLQNDPDNGQSADVAYFGVIKGELGATVSYGDTLAVNNDGEFIQDAEVSGGGTDLHHLGYALEAGADGEIIDILLLGPRLHGTE